MKREGLRAQGERGGGTGTEGLQPWSWDSLCCLRARTHSRRVS